MVTRWLTHLTIAAYLTVLAAGVACHAVSFGTGAHSAMYFIVWDMFCGWAAYSERVHVIGEGESGKHYQLAPGPWGDFHPFGDVGRQHYDTFLNASYAMAHNTLKHTEHEPMTRIVVVQECWPKKFNLPQRIWQRYYETPKDIQKYFRVRQVFTPDGLLTASAEPWYRRQFHLGVASNPRLQADSLRGRPFYAVQPKGHSRGSYAPGSLFPDDTSGQPAGSRLGN